jgi:regulatory protein
MKSGMSEKSYQKFLSRAQYLCSRQEKCIFDIGKKLREWEVPEQYHEKILNELQEGKYIDENRYAESFVKSKFRGNKWGRLKIRFALKSKKINEEIISQAILAEIPEENYLEVLLDLLKRKNRETKDSSGRKKLGKLINYATGKGFEYDLAKATAEQILLDD